MSATECPHRFDCDGECLYCGERRATDIAARAVATTEELFDCCQRDSDGECIIAQRDSLRARVEAYGLGDRPQSPPAWMLARLRELETAAAYAAKDCPVRAASATSTREPR